MSARLVMLTVDVAMAIAAIAVCIWAITLPLRVPRPPCLPRTLDEFNARRSRAPAAPQTRTARTDRAARAARLPRRGIAPAELDASKSQPHPGA